MTNHSRKRKLFDLAQLEKHHFRLAFQHVQSAEIFNSLHPGKLFMLFYRLIVFFFFQNQIFRKKSYFRNTTRVSNSLDQDQARQNVGPGLGQNCLQDYQQTTPGDINDTQPMI